MKKLLFPLYPILLGIIWVLLTYSANKEILLSMSVVVKPALIVTGITAIVWCITQLIVRDWKKAALITAVIFLFSVVHGYIREYTSITGIRLVPIWLALMAVGIFAILKITRPKGRESLTVVGNVVSVGILIVSLVFSISAPLRVSTSIPVDVNSIHNPTPDVYYIIPDTYTSNYILGDSLNYDNSEFTNFLKSRNFTVVDDSWANYNHSILSISSVLNMKYWSDEELGKPAFRTLAGHLVDNPVANTFKAANYTYVHLGSWWGFTSTNEAADITYPYSSLSELDFALFRLTLWYDLLSGDSILRDAHLKQLENLVSVSKMKEHTFTFCHLILPHPPFLFDENGNSISPWVLSSEDWKSSYLEQLTYTNKLLEQAIDSILANSEVTPIIILCADEGYSDTEWQIYLEDKKSLTSIVDDELELLLMRQGNFFAILNPYGDIPSSPVNMFPTVFNCLFNSSIEYLPDRHFIKELERYEGDFIEVTEVING